MKPPSQDSLAYSPADATSCNSSQLFATLRNSRNSRLTAALSPLSFAGDVCLCVCFTCCLVLLSSTSHCFSLSITTTAFHPIPSPPV
ncbi:uncharacterized protein BO95DRAFT_8207 [Aspergillus brunneoviolaceus CBS 621.78]|uniref:Uncharacterized protein n=1 Tax=Aspergillus brunneoviolaceus CBS 621.78 TaxID=1450534 RepID=A0ACD1GR36_9EURO|nr:hypothetical protein BO95DRAFT_8207 [Aspergillus brunneoviolaceus CBS 621.78]RAH51607.1 hypothetical protein BO95DRAFT_8207 [Aspergillus brunneoviolaceus CBS 621.78]